LIIPFDLNELPVEEEDSQRVEDADELDDNFQRVEDADELDDDDLPVEDTDELDVDIDDLPVDDELDENDLPVKNGNSNLPFLSCLLCHY
jgi:hypothetical protein